MVYFTLNMGFYREMSLEWKNCVLKKWRNNNKQILIKKTIFANMNTLNYIYM